MYYSSCISSLLLSFFLVTVYLSLRLSLHPNNYELVHCNNEWDIICLRFHTDFLASFESTQLGGSSLLSLIIKWNVNNNWDVSVFSLDCGCCWLIVLSRTMIQLFTVLSRTMVQLFTVLSRTMIQLFNICDLVSCALNWYKRILNVLFVLRWPNAVENNT